MFSHVQSLLILKQCQLHLEFLNLFCTCCNAKPTYYRHILHRTFFILEYADTLFFVLNTTHMNFLKSDTKPLPMALDLEKLNRCINFTKEQSFVNIKTAANIKNINE
jgi:hypothetical protein